LTLPIWYWSGAYGCLAHARRKFFEAKTANAQLSQEALELFGKVYAVEKHIREHNLIVRQSWLID
jgi:hypothetical protein